MTVIQAPTYPDSSVVFGDARFDTVAFAAPRSDYRLVVDGPGLVEAVGRGQDVSLISIAAIQFNDQTVLIADAGAAGVARTYATLGVSVAADDLRFWQAGGGATAAAHWLLSEREPSPSPESFVRELYHDVLGREPDAPGFAGWTDAMHHGATPEAVVIGFANSPENVARVAAAGWLLTV